MLRKVYRHLVNLSDCWKDCPTKTFWSMYANMTTKNLSKALDTARKGFNSTINYLDFQEASIGSLYELAIQ